MFARVSMARDHIDFISLYLRSTKVIRWLYPSGKICVTGGHVTSRDQGLLFQRPREEEKRDPGNEAGYSFDKQEIELG